MTRDDFRALVTAAIDTIPDQFASAINNVAIVVEDRPSPELLRDMEMEDGDLMGLYQGTPLTERGSGYGNQLPDQITLFKLPIESACEGDEDCIVEEIGMTLIHELGHYFGMSEDEIMAVEDQYWYGGEDDEGA
ncbi:MAG TPA: metallopeptidase family protein [Vicinamibacterales bacterium]|nr:metallopeptidase family protein [Vicinamibacterales bacterium]